MCPETDEIIYNYEYVDDDKVGEGVERTMEDFGTEKLNGDRIQTISVDDASEVVSEIRDMCGALEI